MEESLELTDFGSLLSLKPATKGRKMVLHLQTELSVSHPWIEAGAFYPPSFFILVVFYFWSFASLLAVVSIHPYNGASPSPNL